MRAAISILMMIAMMSPAAAQIRLFKDGQIIKLGPTKAERRARQTGVMMGAMSGRHPAPDATRPQGAPPQTTDQNISPDIRSGR